MSTWLRLLGAEIGDGVYFDTVPPVETDRLEIQVSRATPPCVVIVPVP